MTSKWPWVVLAALGAYHGLNPGMGWLFALTLGLQEKRRSAVLSALVPIALGHAVAIAAAVFLVRLLQPILPFHALKWVVAAILFALGIYRFFRAGHPRAAGMRVNRWELGVWSFLMASANGAGLMIVPVLLAHPMVGMSHNMTETMSSDTAPLSMIVILLAVLVHTGAMVIVAGVLAIVFFEGYEKSGLKLLRHTWLNFDLLWALALVVAGFGALWS